MMKVSDYVARFLVDKGIDHLFLVSGGGIMHLTDSVGRQEGLTYIANHHEQASAIAAESYARMRNGVGAVLVTTGPGATNALSAIAGAYVDSVPVFVISGQVRRDIIANYATQRQVGPQEINIIDMARPVTKYATTVMDPNAIPEELEKAYQAAISGRPGPVWINIPLDVQGANIDIDPDAPRAASKGEPALSDATPHIEELLAMLRKARRPLWLFGHSIHLANSEAAMERLVETSGFPAVFPIGGLDLLGEEHPLNMGRFGPFGQRRANFALQNSDLVIAVGASLSIASIGFNSASFAPKAKKILINVDAGELAKPNLSLDLAIQSDLRPFLKALQQRLQSEPPRLSPRWLSACDQWKKRYPTLTPDYFENKTCVNTYVFVDKLSQVLEASHTVVTGNSLDAVSVNQAFKVKRGQRVYTNMNFGAMGWCLPASIGAYFANGKKLTVLVTGDGSIQFNLQELLTMKFLRANIKIFVINNGGYESIRATQRNFFASRFVGSDPESGIVNPDFEALARAYGFHYTRIVDNDAIDGVIEKTLALDGPVICELNASPNQPRSPRVTSTRRADGSFETKPLEDMFPFLPPEEVFENMHMFDAEDMSAKDS